MTPAKRIMVARFQCPHCNRTRSARPAAERHIERCFKNPAARGCKTCALFEYAEKGDFATGYPGCPEGCGAGLNILDGLLVHCSEWQAHE